MNFIFFSTYIKRLYNLNIQELLYDSEIESLLSTVTDTTSSSNLSGDTSSLSSIDEDDYYNSYFTEKNGLEEKLFGKNHLCFIFYDENNNYYGMYYPGFVTGSDSFSMNVSFFILTNGIEVNEVKYETRQAFTSLLFSVDDYLLKVGEGNGWLFKLYYDHIKFNQKQKILKFFNKNVMRSSKIKRFFVFKLN